MKNKYILLLIEDNPLLVGMYKMAFEKKGVNVLFAHDGKMGLHLVKEKKPDIVLLDLLMPGMDGFEILKALRKDPATKRTKVIILTIVDDTKKRQKAEKFGILDYLLKSKLELHEIVEKVCSYFGK
jgi:DNA-binding response OmpR family regulator